MINIKVFKDVGYVAVAFPDAYVVGYKVYVIEGETSDGGILFHRADSLKWPDSVLHIHESECYLSGNVDWQGCSNWHFDEQDRIRLHGCTREDLTAMGEIMARCWDWTAELCPNWDISGIDEVREECGVVLAICEAFRP